MRPHHITATWLCLFPLSGCDGGASLLLIPIGFAIGTIISQRKSSRALHNGVDNDLNALDPARTISAKQHREVEFALRRVLSLAAAGEAVSFERQWSARTELGALLVAEWRLDEAKELYLGDYGGVSRELGRWIEFRRLELELLQGEARGNIFERIAALKHSPGRPPLEPSWRALEGLALAKSGRAREAIEALFQGVSTLEKHSTRIVYLYHLAQSYEYVGERQLAGKYYQYAEQLFPGTRLASESRSRRLAIGPAEDGGGALFRQALPSSADFDTDPAANLDAHQGVQDDSQSEDELEELENGPNKAKPQKA